VDDWNISLIAGIAASVVLAQTVYDVPANVILESAARAVGTWDVVTSMIKAWVFGVIISVVRPCSHFMSQALLPALAALAVECVAAGLAHGRVAVADSIHLQTASAAE